MKTAARNRSTVYSFRSKRISNRKRQGIIRPTIPEEEVKALLLSVPEPLDRVGHQTVNLAPQHRGLVVETSRHIRHEDVGSFGSLGTNGGWSGTLEGVAFGVCALNLEQCRTGWTP